MTIHYTYRLGNKTFKVIEVVDYSIAFEQGGFVTRYIKEILLGMNLYLWKFQMVLLLVKGVRSEKLPFLIQIKIKKFVLVVNMEFMLCQNQKAIL